MNYFNSLSYTSALLSPSEKGAVGVCLMPFKLFFLMGENICCIPPGLLKALLPLLAGSEGPGSTQWAPSKGPLHDVWFVG